MVSAEVTMHVICYVENLKMASVLLLFEANRFARDMQKIIGLATRLHQPTESRFGGQIVHEGQKLLGGF